MWLWYGIVRGRVSFLEGSFCHIVSLGYIILTFCFGMATNQYLVILSDSAVVIWARSPSKSSFPTLARAKKTRARDNFLQRGEFRTKFFVLDIRVKWEICNNSSRKDVAARAYGIVRGRVSFLECSFCHIVKVGYIILTYCFGMVTNQYLVILSDSRALIFARARSLSSLLLDRRARLLLDRLRPSARASYPILRTTCVKIMFLEDKTALLKKPILSFRPDLGIIRTP